MSELGLIQRRNATFGGMNTVCNVNTANKLFFLSIVIVCDLT
jgi:hypothetical protein